MKTIQQNNLDSSLEGRRIVVTGASSGIGRAIARNLSIAGVNVIAVDRSDAVADVDDAAEHIRADLTNMEDLDLIASRAGAIDGLVNAAGVSLTVGLDDVTEEVWDTTFAINTKAVFFLTQKLSQQLNRGSAIVNLSSIAGKNAANINGIPYNASKAAVIALTKTFAFALAPSGIRVNAICPGITDTPMLTEIFRVNSVASDIPASDLIETYLKNVPLGRVGQPDEIADAAHFLLSTRSSYMTGQSINVCGGLVTW